MSGSDYFGAASGAAPLAPLESAAAADPPGQSWPTPPSTPTTYPISGRLGFMGNLRVGFELIPVCWRVLMMQPSMLVVPVVVAIGGAAAIVGYVDAFGSVASLVGPNKYAAALKCFPLLAMLMALNVVGQAVIVAAATADLDGQRRSLSAAWTRAGLQLPRLLFFGVVYAGERTITSMIRGKHRWSVGSIAADAIDRAWDFATFLTIPVLLYEDLPVFKAVARSGQLVAKRWGVQLTANAVLSVAMTVLMIPVMVIGFWLLHVSAVVGLAVLGVAAAGVVVVAATLNGVLSAALYRFATTGVVAPGFSDAEMSAVFSRR